MDNKARKNVWVITFATVLASLFSSNAQAAEIPRSVLERMFDVPEELNEHQKMIYRKIAVEARLQGIPLEYALASADVESKFQDRKNPWGTAHGPLQVHVGALYPHERKNLPNLDWNIKKGVKILGELLKKARGKTLHARAMYMCGPKPLKTCSESTRVRIQERWKDASDRWKVPVRYKSWAKSTRST